MEDRELLAAIQDAVKVEIQNSVAPLVKRIDELEALIELEGQKTRIQLNDGLEYVAGKIEEQPQQAQERDELRGQFREASLPGTANNRYAGFDYTNVPDEVRARASQETEKNGYHLEAIHYRSNHPDDAHLFNVIASSLQDPDNGQKCAKWMFNSDTGSLNYGHYKLTMEQAEKKLMESRWDAHTNTYPAATTQAQPIDPPR